MQRRTLAKGFLTAAAAAFGSHAIAKEAIPNFKWEEETDVLIAGFGGAGAAAAIEAHDAGARVLILEKLEAGGGNTSVSAGGIMIPKNKEEAYEYLTKTFEYAGSEMDQELLRTFVDQIVQQREFLLGMAEGSRMGRYGGAGFPTLPHADTIDKYTFMWKELSAGPALFAMYHNAVVNLRKIPVRYNTPAVRLIVDGGRVVGIQAGKEGVLKNYRAKKAVILACGGYEYSSEMLSNFAKGMKIHALGCPGNTGDGIMEASSESGNSLWYNSAYYNEPEAPHTVMQAANGVDWYAMQQHAEAPAFEQGEAADAYNQAAFRNFMPGFEQQVAHVDGTHREDGHFEVRHTDGSGTAFYDTARFAAPRGDYQVYEDVRGQQWIAIHGDPAVERKPVFEDGKPVYDGENVRTVSVESVRYKNTPSRFKEPEKRPDSGIKAPKRRK